MILHRIHDMLMPGIIRNNDALRKSFTVMRQLACDVNIKERCCVVRFDEDMTRSCKTNALRIAGRSSWHEC
jgi:hypothetical protein